MADPWIDDDDISMVIGALKEKRLSMGKYVEQFERLFAEFCGTNHAIAMCNGTSALHLALAAINLQSGDDILVPSFSYISSANCILYQGCRPIFVDVDENTFCIDPSDINRKITPSTKAIIVVHYAGQCVDMDPIIEIAKKHHLTIIEDAAEAHGSTYNGKTAGSLGDLACFSFTPNKNMTTGEGGMVTTNDNSLEKRLRLLRSHSQLKKYYQIPFLLYH